MTILIFFFNFSKTNFINFHFGFLFQLYSPHSHTDSWHSYPYSLHSHPYSWYAQHSHPDFPNFHHFPHSVPRFPIPTFTDSLIYKDIFAQMEVIRAFMKKEENRENIYKMLNAWLRNCISLRALIKKEKNDTKKETGRKMLADQLSSF